MLPLEFFEYLYCHISNYRNGIQINYTLRRIFMSDEANFRLTTGYKISAKTKGSNASNKHRKKTF